VIRLEAGMSTSRFCQLLDVPERTWRRWQAHARAGRRPKGPWPQPARDQVREAVLRHAGQHPSWGHRKIWAMCAYDGYTASQATVMRVLQDEGMLLSTNYTKERRDLAGQRKKAFAIQPTRPNEVWQLDFSAYETVAGGTWQIAGCRDYWSKYEFDYHLSPTANQYDAIAALEAALAEAEAMVGTTLLDLATDTVTAEITPILTIVTDNGGPFRSFRFQAFIATHPELRHVRTRVRSPGQNGSRERGFGTLNTKSCTANQSTTPWTYSATSPTTASNTTACAHTRPSPSTGPRRCTSAWPTRQSPPFKPRKSCQLLDTGQRGRRRWPVRRKWRA